MKLRVARKILRRTPAIQASLPSPYDPEKEKAEFYAAIKRQEDQGIIPCVSSSDMWDSFAVFTKALDAEIARSLDEVLTDPKL